MKLMGVEGAKVLPEGAPGTTQDFILISDSRFVTKDVAEFDGLVKALVGGTIAIAWYFLTHLRVARNLMSSLRRHSTPTSTSTRSPSAKCSVSPWTAATATRLPSLMGGWE